MDVSSLPLLDPETWSPLPPTTVRCGLRTDLPKAQRRHQWLNAGLDVRHRFSGEFGLSQVLICQRCGMDKGVSVVG